MADFSDDFVDNSEDDDILDDLFLPDDDADSSNSGFDPKEIQKIKEQLAEKDRQITGLLNTVKTDRKKKQEYKGQLDAVTETVNQILSQREQAEKLLARTSSDVDDRIEVDITEDGDAFIPKSKLNDAVAPLQQQIEMLEERLKIATTQQEAARNSEKLIQSLVGEDERYNTVYNKYQSARKWVNDKVIDFQQENNIKRQLNSGEALTHVFDERAEQEFNKLFPGFDLASVTTAEDSTWHFKQMLKRGAESIDSLRVPDDRFRRVVNKPSTLGKSTNAKAGELSLSERVSGLSTQDIMSLSDAQIEALSKFMRDDEQKGGVQF
jgi:hypothetical protein